jgi:hypothetical protein
MRPSRSYPSLPPVPYPGMEKELARRALPAGPRREIRMIKRTKGPGDAPGQGRITGIKERWRGQQGVAAVEFALVLPLFLRLIFGVMDQLGDVRQGPDHQRQPGGHQICGDLLAQSLMVGDIRSMFRAICKLRGSPIR